jgi:hypothetical protein
MGVSCRNIESERWEIYMFLFGKKSVKKKLGRP